MQNILKDIPTWYPFLYELNDYYNSFLFKGVKITIANKM